ncbi:HAD-IIA family hydrolase [Paenibacillus sp. NPDC058910]|uniref:HAD-IIA family hydrolase n=1 Tax=unclassified Paenibacillus TaxID=185978 RepID=UPI0036CE714C
MRSKNETVEELLRWADAWFFDLDGSIHFGDAVAPGAREVVARLRAAGKRVAYVTNNSRHSAAEIAAKLRGLGLAAEAEDVVAATEGVGRYARERYGALRVKAAGSDALRAALAAAGHEVVGIDDEACPEAVVVGLDRAFAYAKLARLVRDIERGAKLIAANADRSHPGSGGSSVPETGALVAAIEAAVGARAEFAGKPEPHLFRYALELGGWQAGNCVMVGDNYGTDIVGGKRAGMLTAWLSGLDESAAASSASSHPDADLIVRHLPDIHHLLGG